MCIVAVLHLLNGLRRGHVDYHRSGNAGNWRVNCCWQSLNCCNGLQVLEIVRSNYDSLTLKMQDSLDQFERYSEKPKETTFFSQLVCSLFLFCFASLSFFLQLNIRVLGHSTDFFSLLFLRMLYHQLQLSLIDYSATHQLFSIFSRHSGLVIACHVWDPRIRCGYEKLYVLWQWWWYTAFGFATHLFHRD